MSIKSILNAPIASTSPCDNIDHVSFPSLCAINSHVRQVHLRKVAQPYYLNVVILEDYIIITLGKGVITYPFASLLQVLL